MLTLNLQTMQALVPFQAHKSDNRNQHQVRTLIYILKFFPLSSMVAVITHSVTKQVVTQPQTSSGKFSNDQYICNFFNSLEWWLFQHIQLLEKAMSKENKPSKLVNNKIIIQFLNINDKYLS
jgi:hypothetical protein